MEGSLFLQKHHGNIMKHLPFVRVFEAREQFPLKRKLKSNLSIMVNIQVIFMVDGHFDT